MESDALQIFLASVQAAKPASLFSDFFQKNPDISHRINKVRREEGRIFVLSLGKAGYTLAKEFNKHHVVDEGFIYTKYKHLPEKIEFGNASSFIFREGSHPLPSEKNVEISLEIIQWMKKITNKDLFIVLLSGGGSALLELPFPPHTIQEIINANVKFLKSGLPITEINKKRKELSQVKGGGLLSFLSSGVPVLSLVLSDVISDDPEIIASAPTYPGSDYYIIGNLKQSLGAAKKYAESLGYHVIVYDDKWDRDSKETGAFFAKLVSEGLWKMEILEYGKVAVLIGGEMVATVNGDGLGGRNQEAALSFAISAHNHNLKNVCFLAAGTDGTDGPTNVAGAIVNEHSYQGMKDLGFDPEKQLANSDSFPILQRIGAHVMTGPTGTNVNDLLVLLIK
jgi:hydroxypyruvate reductase